MEGGPRLLEGGSQAEAVEAEAGKIVINYWFVKCICSSLLLVHRDI